MVIAFGSPHSHILIGIDRKFVNLFLEQINCLFHYMYRPGALCCRYSDEAGRRVGGHRTTTSAFHSVPPSSVHFINTCWEKYGKGGGVAWSKF